MLLQTSKHKEALEWWTSVPGGRAHREHARLMWERMLENPSVYKDWSLEFHPTPLRDPLHHSHV